MRDLIDIVILNESPTLAPGEFKNRPKRWQTFIEKIKSKSPFTTTSGTKVVIEPTEADRFMSLYKNNQFIGPLKAKLIAGSAEEEIPLSKLAKTVEFGGAASDTGKADSNASKEGLLVKPSQIGIVDKNIPAEDLYDTIRNNPVLNSTEYGKVIIQLAEYIVAGEYVMLPEEYQKKDKVKIQKAIEDYAGEYLGVLALLYGRSRFPAKARFIEWLGSSTDELVLMWPGKANTALADSFATVTNPKTNHTLNISSKGGGGGAAPSISGLKIPPHVESNPKYRGAVKFIDICKNEGTIDQVFSAMDLIYKLNPKSLDKVWHQFLPFATKAPQLRTLAEESYKDYLARVDTPLPKKYRAIVDMVGGKASEGGKAIYAIKKAVMKAINEGDAIPEFKSVILEVLNMNFIQQYTDYKGGEYTFATQWPGKLEGDISVTTKSSASDPKFGGFSFKLGRTDAENRDLDDDMDDDGSLDSEPLVGKKDEKDFQKGAAAVADPSLNKSKPRDQGRKKR